MAYDIGDTVILAGEIATNHTRGSITEGSPLLTCQSVVGYANTDTIVVRGAGVEGSDLITTVSSISGNVITLALAASETVVRAEVAELVNGTAAFAVEKPDGTASAVSASNIGVGRYEGTYDPTVAGDHWYGLTVTGAAKAYGEETFFVNEKRVA